MAEPLQVVFAPDPAPPLAGIARPKMVFCHAPPLDHPYGKCLSQDFCTVGKTGRTPALASTEFSVLCRLDMTGNTVGIEICRDITQELQTQSLPPYSTLEDSIGAELRRVCQVKPSFQM